MKNTAAGTIEIIHISGGRYEYEASDGTVFAARQTPMQDWELTAQREDGFVRLSCEKKGDVNAVCVAYERGDILPTDGFVTNGQIFSH